MKTSEDLSVTALGSHKWTSQTKNEIIICRALKDGATYENNACSYYSFENADGTNSKLIAKSYTGDANEFTIASLSAGQLIAGKLSGLTKQDYDCELTYTTASATVTAQVPLAADNKTYELDQ